MKKICLIASVFFLLTAGAQTPLRVSGTVRDSANKPVDFVTVLLLRASDSSSVKFEVAQKDGSFGFSGVSPGMYRIGTSAVGYLETMSDPFRLAADSPHLVRNIMIRSRSEVLKEVTVVAKKPLIEMRLDKMVVNVNASPANAGNTAMEVLEKLPGTNVDREGNISLRGKQGVKVYVNGEPSYLSTQDLAVMLRGMSSSQLNQIEIITQPSAKFDASGNSGIINIQMEKSKMKGFNGSVTASFVQGKYMKSPNSANFNYSNGKLNMYANFTYSPYRDFNDVELRRKFRNAGNLTRAIFEQASSNKFTGTGMNGQLGLDLSITNRTSLGFSVTGTSNNVSTLVNSHINMLNGNGIQDSLNIATVNRKETFRNIGVNAGLRHQIDSNGREISFGADYLHYSLRSIQDWGNHNYLPDGNLSGNPYFLRANLPSEIGIYSARVDYIHPFRGKARLEIGAKSSLIKTDNNAPYEIFDSKSESWVNDTSRTDHFKYDENINAVYANFNKELKRWTFQLGLRYEHTHSIGTQVLKGNKYVRHYGQLFPTAYASYEINAKNKMVLSYGRRVERPNYQDMNPFQRFIDRYTFIKGNPFLTPQFSNNFELTHNYDGKLTTTINYTVTDDIINDVLKQDDSTRVIFRTKENISQRKNLGVAISYNAALTNWWTTSLFLNVFNNTFTGTINDRPLDVNITSFSFNFNQQFSFGKGWNAEASGFYRSRIQDRSLYVMEPMGVVSFGLGKKILHNKGFIKLSLSDPFYLQRSRSLSIFDNINLDARSSWDSRRVGLTFTYRFSKGQKISERKTKIGTSEDEQNRVD
jgi:hypothetical protein